MITDRAKIEAADVGFRIDWNLAIEKMRGKTLWQTFADEVQSGGRSEQYNWITALPKMKKWVSDAQFSKLQAYKFTVENEYYQAGLEVKREDILDDRLNLIKPAIALLAENAARHPDDLVFTLLNNGFGSTSGLAYDGQYFFDTDHKDGLGATQSNKGTAALTAASFQAARTAMQKLQDESGVTLRIMPTHLVVPPDLEAMADSIVLSQFLASGATNPNYHKTEVIVVPQLSSATAWFLFDFSKPIKPLVFQVREPLQFANQDSMTDENAFMRRVYRYSAFDRCNAGYAMWQMSYGSDGTT